jgi:hypothetical protein
MPLKETLLILIFDIWWFFFKIKNDKYFDKIFFVYFFDFGKKNCTQKNIVPATSHNLSQSFVFYSIQFNTILFKLFNCINNKFRNKHL